MSRGGALAVMGPGTIGILAKWTGTGGATGWALDADDTTFVKWGLLVSSGKLYIENDFGAGGSFTSGNWCWMVVTKASGSVAPRWHVLDLTAGGGWAHANETANVNDFSGSATEIIIGGQFTGGAGAAWRGSIAVAATFPSALSDAAVEAAFTLNASDLLAASPGWMIRLNQASTATAVTDDTSGGSTQSSISGTSIDSDTPPGFSFSLGGGGQSVTPAGLSVPVALGTPTLTQSFAVTPNGLSVPVALGTPGTTQSFTASPNGLSIPITLGTPTLTQAAAGTISPNGLLIPVALGTPTLAQSFAVSPTGMAVPIGLGQPTVRMTISPVGLTIPVGLGLPTITSDAPPPATQLKQGSWWGLKSILDIARTERQEDLTRQPVACPNDGEPLRINRQGHVYCPYDGWMPDGQMISHNDP
jgi:hypothetical protein